MARILNSIWHNPATGCAVSSTCVSTPWWARWRHWRSTYSRTDWFASALSHAVRSVFRQAHELVLSLSFIHLTNPSIYSRTCSFISVLKNRFCFCLVLGLIYITSIQFAYIRHNEQDDDTDDPHIRGQIGSLQHCHMQCDMFYEKCMCLRCVYLNSFSHLSYYISLINNNCFKLVFYVIRAWIVTARRRLDRHPSPPHECIHTQQSVFFHLSLGEALCFCPGS